MTLDMRKVLIATKLEELAGRILSEAGYAVMQDSETPIEGLVLKNSDAQVLIVRSERVTPEIIDCLPELKLIVRAGAGYDTIDIAYARQKNIDVMNTPGANANAVAEEVVAMVLAHYRHIIKGDSSTRAGLWEKKKLMGSELSNKTVGIVGLGNIGRLVAKRLQGFENTILGYDPVLAPAKARKLGIEPCELEELFSRADVITIHVPGGAETKNMVNSHLISKMKKGSVLVNCARYGIVDEDAIRNAKKTGAGIHYLTDVYEEDKAGEKAVADIASLMLPHLGASTIEANLTAARRAAEQIIAYFDQGITSCVVNKGTPDGLKPEYQRLAWLLTSVARKYTNGKPIRQVDCTYYGELEPFGKWFLAPILAGLTPGTNEGMMPADAGKAFQQKGITVVERQAIEGKHYGNSMTIDLLTENSTGKMECVSIRGTITEAVPVISRLNGFDGIYFSLKGYNLFVVYEDRPGVIALISNALLKHNINIDNITAPRDHKNGISLAILRVDQQVPEEVLSEIKANLNPVAAFAIGF